MTRGSVPDIVIEALDRLVADAADAHGEDGAAAGLVVALSGGPDSVALLLAAHRWAAASGRALLAAHYNHRLRGEASDGDERFCRELCAGLGVDLVTGGGDPRAVARQRGRGLEDAARHLRHGFLEATRAARGLTAIATGHHRDDQAETVLMRVLRGTGLDGLRGLKPREGRLVHPMLAVTRADVLAWLEAEGRPWREDASNLDGSNRRGRVRRELLPLARDIFGEGAGLASARLADLAEADLAWLDEQADEAWRRLAGPALSGQSGPSLDVAGAADLPPALSRRVIRRWLAGAVPHDLELVHVDDVRRWLAAGQSGTGLDLPGPVRLERVFDRAGVADPAPPSADATAWRVVIRPLPEPPAEPGPPTLVDGVWSMVCAADGLQGNLRLRNPRPGDRLQPFGLAGTRKLSDLAQEKRIAAALRPGLLVVEDDAGILWVPQVAQDERTRVLPSTRQAVTISVERRRGTAGL
jgi:tRNA(Ile)-lysidine synthase